MHLHLGGVADGVAVEVLLVVEGVVEALLVVEVAVEVDLRAAEGALSAAEVDSEVLEVVDSGGEADDTQNLTFEKESCLFLVIYTKMLTSIL